jgi:hypothetical protein
MSQRVMAYGDTAVPVERSQKGIRDLLQKYGASVVQFNEDFGGGKISMRFSYAVAVTVSKEGAEPLIYRVRLQAVVPAVKETRRTPSGGVRDRGARTVQQDRERNQRAAWRAVYYALKSRMESVSYGIETFEEAFLAHFEAGVDRAGNTFTIGDRLIPRLQAGRLALAEKVD